MLFINWVYHAKSQIGENNSKMANYYHNLSSGLAIAMFIERPEIHKALQNSSTF